MSMCLIIGVHGETLVQFDYNAPYLSPDVRVYKTYPQHSRA